MIPTLVVGFGNPLMGDDGVGAAVVAELARISHQLSAAAGDAPHPARFSRLGVLDVQSSTPPRPSGRKPHGARHLAALATKPGEIGGLDQIGAPPGLRLSTLADVLHLSSVWRGEARVWMVDAVLCGAAPGAVHRLGHEEVLEHPQRHATVHHLSLAEGLRWIVHGCPAMAGVRFRLWGVEPESVEPVEALSPVVARAALTVAREIADRSRHPVRRPGSARA